MIKQAQNQAVGANVSELYGQKKYKIVDWRECKNDSTLVSLGHSSLSSGQILIERRVPGLCLELIELTLHGLDHLEGSITHFAAGEVNVNALRLAVGR